jgi:tetratricopeptide (TPR) repeat protein
MMVLAVFAGPVAAQDSGAAPPAEELRFDGNVFRHGLKRRGLDELLELHLRDFPPRDPGSRLLMERDIKLARFADPSLPRAERMAALTEANEMLARIIELRPDDSDRFDWMLTLGRSLVTEEAEPHFAAIVYHGGSATDRLRLGELSSRAIGILERVKSDIDAEFERMDGLSTAQFETLEKSGFVEKLDRMAPEAEYRLLWAWFHDALSRSTDDPLRRDALLRVKSMLSGNAGLIDVPHEVSRVQAPSILLQGMTHRRLAERKDARETLDRAAAIVESLTDPTMKANAAWVADVAAIERIRTEMDGGLLDEALAMINRFALAAGNRDDQGFSLRLVAALLEREVWLIRVADAVQGDNRVDAARYRNAAWAPLARLAKREPDRREEIYALLNDKTPLDADPAGLDPFQRCAMIAGLLRAASAASDTDGERTAQLLQRAVDIGRDLLASAGEAEADLVPEVLYNLGVAYQRQGRLQQAADSFLRIARERPDYGRAAQSAALAVQIASRLYEAQRTNDAARRVYFESLETLLQRFEASADAMYWRFFYARALDDIGRHDEAARQYAKVDADHEHYLDAVHARFQSLGMLIAGKGPAPASAVEQQRLVAEFLDAQRAVVSRLVPAAAQEQDPARAAELKRYLASATIIHAEGHITPMLQRPEKALEILDGFETKFGDEPGLIGRVYRTRMTALERLGRADEAVALIPAFVEKDAENAGPTLQSLYEAAVVEWTALYEAGQDPEAKAEVALRIAQQVEAWTADPRFSARVGSRRAVQLQSAQAQLRAGQAERALEAFADLLGVEPPTAEVPANAELAVVWGYAESLYLTGKLQAALPLFNRIFLGTPATEPLHFRALLRDLQARLELGQPPADVLRVIQQHETLHPEIGPSGPTRTARELQALKRQVQRRE